SVYCCPATKYSGRSFTVTTAHPPIETNPAITAAAASFSMTCLLRNNGVTLNRLFLDAGRRAAVYCQAFFSRIEHAVRARQLRLLHLQPRPVSWLVGRGSRCLSERRAERRRGAGVEAHRRGALARSQDARAGGHPCPLGSGTRRPGADAGRVPRPSGDRRGVRREDRPRATPDAREDLSDRAQRRRAVRRDPQSVYGDALSLAR